MTQPVAILLGATVGPGGAATPTLRRRAEKAAALYHAGTVSRIVASGGVGRFPPAEAEVARDLLLGLGVPPEAVIIEDRSHNTLENIAFSKDLLPPGTPVVIVSDAWHLPRARLVARRLGLTATGARAGMHGTRPLRTARLALRELAALALYLLRPMR